VDSLDNSLNQGRIEVRQAIRRGESQAIRIAGCAERLGTEFVEGWHLIDPLLVIFFD